MPGDLRTYLADLGDELLVVDREVDRLTQLGELCSQSDRPLLFRQIKDYPGWQIVDDLVKTRRTQAIALGATPDQVVPELARRLARGPQPCRLVSGGPVQERILAGADVDIGLLPIARHSQRDPGPYVGGGMCITRDPDTGSRNCAYLRTFIRAKDHGPFSVAARHNWQHLAKYAARGEPAPMAMAIGHHPLVEIAGNWSGRYGIDELEIAGALLGEPLELVKCKTIDLEVPARAEIVLEGFVPPDAREEEGPFGEFMGYSSPSAHQKPVFQITAITMRHDAIYRHIQSTVFTDHQPLVTLSMEASLYDRLRDVDGFTEIHDVHVPSWAGVFTVIIQATCASQGQARNVLLSALSSSYSHPKVAIVVDADVDIYNARDVLWAISTRVNPAEDVVVIGGTRNHNLDISCPEYGDPIAPGKRERVGGKIGIDATKPPTSRPKERQHFDRVRPEGFGLVDLADFAGDGPTPNPFATEKRAALSGRLTNDG